ncbi:hypothetical protein D6C86_07362 [Aureobasidium pullulans]|uniref:Uncharacterized protein n=1 Tax=Aureobasidium pullulans TaxID=5580 RepID=A0A4S9VYJ5_AURPU|nr:hypothetical protein D6C94_05208 [Aureobasidium pullulans]THZ36073.1 hypothetical protein D6C87_09403 [Aureobasidium pullulans]THZ57078.1 hypothetical protein D6C86_07362 [Aureobasidium pullulans]THZ66485.1 hypothetical protein D6C88_08234 [Aureobasidium pullulans]
MAKKTAFRCRECWYRHENKSFTSFAHMKSHLGSVHKMGWFCCSVRNCDYRALRRDAVTKHITAEKKSQPGGRHAKAEARVNQRLERAIDAETNLCRWPHTTPWTPPAGAAGPVLNPTPAVAASGAASVVAPIIPPVPAPAAGSSQTVSASAAPPVSAPSQADVSPTGGVTTDNDSITSNDIDEEMEDELPGSNHTSLPSSPSPASPSPTLQQSSMPALPSPLRSPPPRLPLSKLATRAIVIGRYYLDRFEDCPAWFSVNCNIKLMRDAIEALEDKREMFNNSPNQFAYIIFAIRIEEEVGDMVEAIRWYEDLFGHHMGALREDVAKLKEMAAGVEENLEARKACGVGVLGGEVQDEVRDEDDQNDQDSQDEDQSEDQDVGWSEDQDGDQSGGQDVQNGQDGQDELDEPMESPLSPLDEPLQSPLSPLDEPMQSPPSPFKELTEEQVDELYA